MLFALGLAIGLFIIAEQVSPEKARWKKATAIAAIIAAVLLVGESGYSLFSVVWERMEPRQEEATVTLNADEVASDRITVARADGGSITTKLGYGITVAEGSTIEREWIAIHNADSPVELVGVPGVTTIFKSGEYRGDFQYKSSFTISAKKPVAALEIKCLLFDVWG